MLRQTTLIIGLLVAVVASHSSTSAQEATVRRAGEPRVKQASGATPESSLSQRALEQSRLLSRDTDHVNWRRTVYRYLDLTDERNAALYYPTTSTEQAQNLFTKLFRLIATEQIKGYEYIDGPEVFDQKHELKFKDLLDRFRISYTEGRGKGNARYEVALPDVPSSEVKAYYLKETWYFDQRTSTYDVKVEAICPILYDLGDYGEVPMPLFWLPYEVIRPHLSAQPVMLSSYNNVASATLDDFFRLKMYHGEIIKTQNLLNRSLAQYATTPDSLKAERKRIEGELSKFEQNLFIADTVKTQTSERTTAEKTARNSRDKRVRSAKSSSKSTKTSTAKATKAAKPKAEKPARTAGRSVRGRH